MEGRRRAKEGLRSLCFIRDLGGYEKYFGTEANKCKIPKLEFGQFRGLEGQCE